MGLVGEMMRGAVSKAETARDFLMALGEADLTLRLLLGMENLNQGRKALALWNFTALSGPKGLLGCENLVILPNFFSSLVETITK